MVDTWQLLIIWLMLKQYLDVFSVSSCLFSLKAAYEPILAPLLVGKNLYIVRKQQWC